MLRGKQFLLNVLAAVLFLAAFYFVANNFNVPVGYKLFTLHFEQAYMGWPLLVAALLMGLAVYFRMMAGMSAGKHEQQKAERQREKAEVSVEESSGKVKALEAKVETLEKALENALHPAGDA